MTRVWDMKTIVYKCGIVDGFDGGRVREARVSGVCILGALGMCVMPRLMLQGP